MSFCPRCYGSGRVYGGPSAAGSPCPRCEPESAEADGEPTCRTCGSVMFTSPGQRANLGWLCGRCDPSARRDHTRVARVAVSSERIDWTRPVEGWRLW